MSDQEVKKILGIHQKLRCISETYLSQDLSGFSFDITQANKIQAEDANSLKETINQAREYSYLEPIGNVIKEAESILEQLVDLVPK